MSLTTALPMVSAPSAAAAISVTTGATTWAYGSWIQLIASASAASQLAGFTFEPASGGSVPWEIEFGVGASGSETSIGSIYVDVLATANIGERVITLPVAIDAIPSGSRVAVRARASAGVAASIGLLYFQTLDSIQKTAQLYAFQPPGSSASQGLALTPNSGAWVNSAYGELTAGIAEQISIVGLTARYGVNSVQFEVDLATGASGSESVITTLRSDTGGRQGFSNLWLPAPYPVAASTRVAARVRKSDTGVGSFTVAVLYLDNTTIVLGGGGGGGGSSFPALFLAP